MDAETGKNIESIDPEVLDILMRHKFPGNIRELENIMQHAFVLCRGNIIQKSHLPHELLPTIKSDHMTTSLTLRSIEKHAVQEALDHHGGNRTAAARELGIDPSTLYRKMRRYGIE